MRKKLIYLSAAFCFLALPLFVSAASEVVDPSELPKEDAYKAIVKIKTFTLNDDYKLTGYSSGSGVIVDRSGLVLTNNHVVNVEEEYDSGEKVSGQIICLTKSIDEEPDCSYIGRLIAKNEDMDIALLKIEDIPGYSFMNDFEFLDINHSGSAEVNDEVVALGYPGIGGDTITITKGIVSGRANKYDRQWIKTDTVTSFGSSGGAAINVDGEVIGITSQANSDMLGTLGYMIDMASVYDWYLSNKSKDAKASEIEERVISFTKLKNSVVENNTYRNHYPSFSVTKPNDWDFSLNDENIMTVDKPSDDDGGIVMLAFGRYPYKLNTDKVKYIAMREYREMGILALVSIVKDEEIDINGTKARSLTISAIGEQQKVYYIPAGQYLIEINFDYGQDDKDKANIDAIINSIELYPEEEAVPDPRSHTNSEPVFSLSALDDWALLPMNSKSHPLFYVYKPVKEAFCDMELKKTDSNTDDLNNEEYLEVLKQQMKSANNLGTMLNYRVEFRQTNAHYRLNDELGDVIMMDYVGKSVDDDKVLVQNREYHIKLDSEYLIPSMNYFSDSETGYNDVLNEFNRLLTTLSLSSSPRPASIPAAALPDDESTPEADIIVEVNQTTPTAALQVRNRNMYERLKGKIMIKVEDAGKAYYVNPSAETVHYLGRPEDAFAVMREQGVGISTANLEKIPVGMSNLSGPDADGDGLPDMFEDAIGTDKSKADTDGDRFNDKQELEGGYSPRVRVQRMNYDDNFSAAQKGKIFLQVEGNGEAWYVNPADGKRYFLGHPSDAFNVMRNLGLGITNADFESL